MDKQYTKLSSLVDNTFTVERVSEFRWKVWDTTQNKMLVSDNFEKGYRKMYTLETDKGMLDLSSSQLGQVLEAVSYKGEASLPGKTIQVKSNGKSGIDIRYFFNAAKAQPKPHDGEPADYDPEYGGY